MHHPLRFFKFPSLHRGGSNLLAGLSAVVALIGGVYLVTTSSFVGKLVDRKTKKQQQESQQQEVTCHVCSAEIATEDANSFVLCSICNKLVCSASKCAVDGQHSNGQWECQTCHSSKQSLANTSSWVAAQMSFNQHKFVYPMRARSEIYIPIGEHNDSNSMIFESASQAGGGASASASTAVVEDAAETDISNEQKQKIREYVEELVAKMLGGSLDSVTVGQMSKSESYLPALANGHQVNSVSNSNSLVDVSQTRLRLLIEAIIAETIRLPLTLTTSSAVSEVAFNTQHSSGADVTLTNGDARRRHRTEHYFEPKIYQELLATAVLNKIADTHGNVRHLTESGRDYIAPDANQNFRERQSSSSGSSVGPRSELSFTDNDQILNLSKGDDFSPCGSHTNLDNAVITDLQLDAGRESALSDYLSTHTVPLPDLSATATESEEDDYISITSSQVGEGNWEDNWLFKKKKSPISSTATAGSVGMLVPAPKDDVRAQIGDQIADEISDLSEMGSDTDDSSLELLRTQIDPLNDRLLNKHLIGGKNTKLVLDELIESTSMVSSTSPAENEPVYTETKNEFVSQTTTTKAEAVNKALTQSLLESSPPSTDTMMDPCEPVILPPPHYFEDPTNQTAASETDTAYPITGSIAEREYKKWYNAVDMPNNPYSPDALQRRISGNQERYIDLPNISNGTETHPMSLMENVLENEVALDKLHERDYKRYSRDYYVNDTKATPNSKTPQTAPIKPDISINEVNRNGFDSVDDDNRASNTRNHHQKNDLHWTLLTPIRRSISLKCIRTNLPNSHYFTTSSPTLPPPLPRKPPPLRSATATSHYSTDGAYHSYQKKQPGKCNEYLYSDCNNNENYDSYAREFDTRSHRSWTNTNTTLPKRRAQSSLSFKSYANNMSKAAKKYGPHLATPDILSQFEKQLLHKDLKRNSFRAVSSTTKEFVLNPLFDRDSFYGNHAKLSLKPQADDDPSDSGVDSCLNGLSDMDARNSKSDSNNLLF